MNTKIKIPDNYDLPAEVADGDVFEELVSFRVEGDSLVPTMIAGVEIAADESEEDMEMEDEAADEMEAGVSPMSGMGERIMGMA
jgi:mannose/fructose/N-acetylgalactosamine-specific phosphotransferase system component IID